MLFSSTASPADTEKTPITATMTSRRSVVVLVCRVTNDIIAGRKIRESTSMYVCVDVSTHGESVCVCVERERERRIHGNYTGSDCTCVCTCVNGSFSLSFLGRGGIERNGGGGGGGGEEEEGTSSHPEAAHWVVLHHVKVHFGSEEFTDVINSIEDHRGSLERKAPCDGVHFRWKSHWLQHLRPEHPRIAHLEPCAEALMICKDFHARLRIRIECRLELEFRHAQASEEFLEEPDEVAQTQPTVDADALDLMKFRKMRLVDGLISEDTIDAEHLLGPETTRVLCKAVQHPAGDRGGVRAQQVFLRFTAFPIIPVATTAVPSAFVRLFHALEIVFREGMRESWICIRAHTTPRVRAEHTQSVVHTKIQRLR